MLARVCRRGTRTHKPLGPYFVLSGGTADGKEDPRMDRLDSADKEDRKYCQSVVHLEGVEVETL